jgi:predicted acylesterase/phospholipase RssA/CRP-like cAMP-binding protein
MTGVKPGLAANRVLNGLDTAYDTAFELALSPMRLSAGEILFRQGDPGESLYLIMRGRLAVQVINPDGTQTVVDELGPPACVGELALLTGQARNATIVALEDAELMRVAREDVLGLAERRPQQIAALAQTVLPRLQRAQLANVLSKLFGALDSAALRELEAALEWQHLAAGELLFRSGDPGDALYIVINGRLSVSVTDARGSAAVVGQVRCGETVGEVGLLTGSPHSATATAVRDTNVVRLSQATFERLHERYPRMMLQVSHLIVQRTQQLMSGARPATDRSATFAILPISRSAPLTSFARRLATALAEHGPTLHLDSARVDRAFGLAGGAQIDAQHPMNVALIGWLDQHEADHNYVVYEATTSWSAWTQRCLRQADRILLLGDASDTPALGALEEQLGRSGVRAQVELVLVQRDDCVQPAGTMAWLEKRRVHAHHHLRMRNDQDWRRLVRRLTGRATGLALSGGSARGLAHIGVIRALEAGVEIDLIGGTSMGALVGAMLVMDFPTQRMVDLVDTFSAPRKLLDVTLPLVSFLSSGRITSILRAVCGDVQIEDLWRPFLCVSSNLTRAEPLVHATGSLWHALRASTAIPGMFAPVLYNGAVLVDGAVLNNFPLDLVRERCEDGVVIGSSVTPLEDRARRYDFGAAVSGWDVLFRAINPFARQVEAPLLFETLLRSIEVNIAQRLKSPAFRQLADVLIEPQVSRFGMLDFDAYEELIDIGYQEALRYLPAIQAVLQACGGAAR